MLGTLGNYKPIRNAFYVTLDLSPFISLISAREHHREGRDRPDGYCETKKRAPKRRREAGERHEFQVVHIARAGRKAMERMASLPRGDG